MSPTDLPVPHPDLMGLLRGELSNADATAAGEHLRGCDTCREDLVDASVGHGLLTRAVEALGPGLPTPTRATPTVTGARRGRRGLGLVAAAAAVVLAAGAGTALVVGSGDAPDPTGPNGPTGSTGSTAAQTAPLTPVSPALDPAGDGRVRMVRDREDHTRMTIRVAGLPTPASDEYYYAWLLDPLTQKMLPLGQVAAAGSTAFDLDDALVSAYSAIDVSLERDDGDPAHSVTSVLRGGYDPDAVTS